MNKPQAVIELIKKWKLNNTMLANQIGMHEKTFANKINPKHGSRFSQNELDALEDVLINLRRDIDNMQLYLRKSEENEYT